MNRFYKLLMQFSTGTKPCKTHLYRRFSKSLVDEALELGYIVECGTNSNGDTRFTITDLGKNVRDD